MLQPSVCCGDLPPFADGSEALWKETVAYQYFAVIDYNTRKPVPGLGSGIFLHFSKGHATAGCVSLPGPELITVLDALRPAQTPRIVIGTNAEIRRF